MTLYKVSELLSKYNIGRDRLVVRCLWIIVKNQVPIRFKRGVCQINHKQLTITRA